MLLNLDNYENFSNTFSELTQIASENLTALIDQNGKNWYKTAHHSYVWQSQFSGLKISIFHRFHHEKLCKKWPRTKENMSVEWKRVTLSKCFVLFIGPRCRIIGNIYLRPRKKPVDFEMFPTRLRRDFETNKTGNRIICLSVLQSGSQFSFGNFKFGLRFNLFQ